MSRRAGLLPILRIDLENSPPNRRMVDIYDSA